jgi:hypothetical protein
MWYPRTIPFHHVHRIQYQRRNDRFHRRRVTIQQRRQLLRNGNEHLQCTNVCGSATRTGSVQDTTPARKRRASVARERTCGRRRTDIGGTLRLEGSKTLTTRAQVSRTSSGNASKGRASPPAPLAAAAGVRPNCNCPDGSGPVPAPTASSRRLTSTKRGTSVGVRLTNGRRGHIPRHG